MKRLEDGFGGENMVLNLYVPIGVYFYKTVLNGKRSKMNKILILK
jgi:hypothetical protein